MEDKIMKEIIKLLKAGYKIKLSKRSLTIIEVFNSQSREKWHEEEVYSCFGADYWEDGSLRIVLERLNIEVKSLVPASAEKEI